MLAFLETPRFNTEIRYGTVGGPEFSTDVVTVNSGAEQRNANWKDSRGKWQIADDLLNKKEMDWLIAFFRERFGRAGGFRFKDWSDWEAKPLYTVVNGVKTVVGYEGVFVAIPNNAGQLQLAKEYTSGISKVQRLIAKPVPGTIKFWSGGTQVTGPSLDYTTGRVSGASTNMYWTGEFDIPARFDVDQFNASFVGYRDSDGESMYEVAGVTIVELNINPLANYIPGQNPLDSSGYIPGGLGTGSTAGITVQISSTSLLGSQSFTGGSGTVISPTISVQATGGDTSAGYRYQWEAYNSPARQTATAGLTSSTLTVQSTVSVGTDVVELWRCRVTDVNGATGYSAYCTVTLRATTAAATPPTGGGTLAATVSPTSVSGYVTSDFTSQVTTSSAAYALPSGGAGFYQYAWEYVSGDSSIQANSPNAAGTPFSGTCAVGQVKQAKFRCRVTDGTSVVYTPEVDVVVRVYASSGGFGGFFGTPF